MNEELKTWRVGRKQREGKRLCIQDGIISPKKKPKKSLRNSGTGEKKVRSRNVQK